MKRKLRNMTIAFALVGIGYCMGFLMSPTTAQGDSCFDGGNRKFILKCPGSYEIMGYAHQGLDVKYDQTVTWRVGGRLFHSVMVTVSKEHMGS